MTLDTYQKWPGRDRFLPLSTDVFKDKKERDLHGAVLFVIESAVFLPITNHES